MARSKDAGTGKRQGRFRAYTLRVAAAFQGMRMRGQLLCVLEILVGYLSPFLGVVVAIVLRALKKDEVWRFFPLAGAVMAMLVFVASYFVAVVTA